MPRGQKNKSKEFTDLINNLLRKLLVYRQRYMGIIFLSKQRTEKRRKKKVQSEKGKS